MIFHFVRGSTDDNHIVIQFYVSDLLAAQASSCTVNKLVFYKYENPFCLLYIMIII